MNLLIFGAQGYALGAYQAIKTLYPKWTIPCFLVSECGYNADTLGGVEVCQIADISEAMSEASKRDTTVIIATPESIQPEIEEILELHGFHNCSRLTSERWGEMMKLYHAKEGKFLPLQALPVGCNKPFIRMYMARSHMDRPLRHSIILPEYVFPIQVGAGKASSRIADIVDNTGENISDRNGNYSELTGLYWLWKNKLEKGSNDSSYYGFGQYRRMLEFSSDDLLRLVDNDVDAVLPYPMPYEPNIHAHHNRYIKKDDWDALMRAVEELEPEYMSYFDKVLSKQYLYNYNVILARKSVLRNYCSWLFPILFRTEELTDGKNRFDRYIGYIAETLETLYFMRNSEKSGCEKYGDSAGDSLGKKLNIVHTLCRLYV